MKVEKMSFRFMYWVWGQIGQKRCFKAFNIAFNANIATTGINTGIIPVPYVRIIFTRHLVRYQQYYILNEDLASPLLFLFVVVFEYVHSTALLIFFTLCPPGGWWYKKKVFYFFLSSIFFLNFFFVVLMLLSSSSFISF